MNERNQSDAPTNRPGLSQIAYRIRDYNAFFRKLLDLLSQPDASGKVPLAKLTTRSTEDPSIALIDAWAIVADVLTFYQERIANEGYLRTATERRSLLELARAIGYEINPGVAASTYLSFTVEDAPDSPIVTKIPLGTQVMSIPEGEELPQNFETSEDFTAYVQWNAIKPRLTRPQKITPQTRQLYLSGIDTQLEAGDSLLLLDEEDPDLVYLLNLKRVETDSQANHTLVQWETPPLPAPLDTPLRQPQLFAFREQAALFGSNAPEWATLSPEIKRSDIEAYGGKIDGGVIRLVGQNNNNWQSNLMGKELPNSDISALIINQGGDLFAAIPNQGVFRLTVGSDRWVEINDGLTNFNIQSLYLNDKGHLFAGGSNGSAGGGAFRSKDKGNSWTEIATGAIGVEPVSAGSNEFRAVNTSISNTVVRSFLTYEENRKIYIFVGTDNGVYRSNDGGKNWGQINNVSGNNAFLDDTVIRSLVLYKKNDKNSIFAGTDIGVFELTNITINSPTWTDKSSNIPQADRDIQILISHNQELYAGTANGKVYKFPESNNNEQWAFLGTIDSDSPQKITSLAVNSEGTILAGTESQGLYYFIGDQTWTQIKPISETTTIPQAITSLVVKEQEFFAGTKFAGFPQEEWSKFEIKATPIQLDTLYPQILNNSLVVLINGEHFEYRRVPSISTPLVNRFNLNAQITQIESNDRLREPKKFKRRTTKVLIQSEPLTLAPEILTIAARGEEIFQDPIQQK